MDVNGGTVWGKQAGKHGMGVHYWFSVSETVLATSKNRTGQHKECNIQNHIWNAVVCKIVCKLYVQLFYITLTSARETCEIHRQCVQGTHPHNLSLVFTRAWHHHSAVHQETPSEDVVPFRGYAPLPWSDMVGFDPHLLPINHWFWSSCGPKLFELRALNKNAGSRGEMMINHGIWMDLRSIPQTYPHLKCKE